MPPTRPDISGYELPTLNLHIEDLSHPGSTDFLTALNLDPYFFIRTCVVTAIRWLYEDEEPNTAVKSITITARPMPGVAHTFGNASVKHIHISTDYIHKIGRPAPKQQSASQGQKYQDTSPSDDTVESEARARRQAEVLGVLTHEAVHCVQYNGGGKCPGGLIEGIADYVRLRSTFTPPHWKRPTPSNIKRTDRWDAGYERTGFFLEWLELVECWEGFVRRLNLAMKDMEYEEGTIWNEVAGKKVGRLWERYCDAVEGGWAGPKKDPSLDLGTLEGSVHWQDVL